MIYMFDIDGVICTTDDRHNYEIASPDIAVIKSINRLYNLGHRIVLFTARGESSGKNWHNLTIKQLGKWGVSYHELIDEGKPTYDIYIDDKSINIREWKNSMCKSIGFVASSFDLLHAGHCKMLKDAKNQCDWLVAALHVDPSMERKSKNKPIQSIVERRTILSSIKYVDEVYEYEKEKDLLKLLELVKPDVRILGSDWREMKEKITGRDLSDRIYFHSRNHNWSSSELRKRIYEVEKNEKG